MSELGLRRLPEKTKRFHNSTRQPTDEMHDWFDGAHRALLRLASPGSGVGGGGGGLGTSSLATTTEQLTGTDAGRMSTPDSVAALWEKGSDVAGATTTSLAEGGFFHITGTTTITDIDFATDKAGRIAWVEFTGILILTHNATTLILPTGANITTAAGDTACFVSEGADAVRCVCYQRKDGTALAAGTSYTDEQVRDVIGAALVAGTGITITVNDAGDTITIGGAAVVGGIGSGVYAPLMTSTRPTLASTGFATYANQGSIAAADNAMGISFTGPSESGNNRLRGKYQAVPATPYTRTAMFVWGDMRAGERAIALGWYDGTKAHVGWVRSNDKVGTHTYSDLNTRAGFVDAYSPRSTAENFLRISDDGTNVSIKYSANGVDWLDLLASTAKSGAYLGGSGYTNIILGMINFTEDSAWVMTDYQ